MSSLLDAVNVEPNKIEITDQLPSRVGDVSIMTIEHAFKALEYSNSKNYSDTHFDPTQGYDTSTYYVYGITGSNGANSTEANLQAVGLDWYKQYNKPTTSNQTFTSNGKTIFGGPLYCMFYNCSSYCSFIWCYSANGNSDPRKSSYWDNLVSSSVCVAVIRVHE